MQQKLTLATFLIAGIIPTGSFTIKGNNPAAHALGSPDSVWLGAEPRLEEPDRSQAIPKRSTACCDIQPPSMRAHCIHIAAASARPFA